jgi:spermidine/putrescine transport system permease protein
MTDEATTASMVEDARRREVRRSWLLSAPALTVLFLAASGPLLVMILYSFLTPGDYGGVKWEASSEGWFGVVMQRDIFDGTLSVADAHLSILWRSVKLSLLTTLTALILGFPNEVGR